MTANTEVTLPPSVRDNTKFECMKCGTIADLSTETNLTGNTRPCPNCGVTQWSHLRITTVCDFCATTQNVRWDFPCAPFKVPIAPGEPFQAFAGAWAACDVCKVFIERDDREALVVRAIVKDPTKARPLRQLVVRQAHQGFFNNRAGDPVLYEEEHIDVE